MQGRGRRLHPQARARCLPLLRQSRPGEVATHHDLLGREVRAWFLQLRRIQSLLHALRAGKMTADAQLYRAELWTAIFRSSGFCKSFAVWWLTRPVKLQASPRVLSRLVPTVDQCQAIFTDFEHNFRRLETWHLRKRRQLLEATFQHQQDRLFSMVKPEAKQPLRHLEQVDLFNVLATNEDQTLLQLDASPSLSEHTTCFLDGQQVEATSLPDGMVQIAHDHLFLRPHTFEVQKRSSPTPPLF